MTVSGPSAVTYVGLPISSGGAHSLGRMSRRTAYVRTADFLHECTVGTAPATLRFTIHRVPKLAPDKRHVRALHEAFGPGDSRVLPESLVDDALDFLDSIGPQPTNEWGMAPIWFTWSVPLQILDPETREPLAGQDPARFAHTEYDWRHPLGTSSVRLILNSRAQIGVELCIPDPDPALLHRVVPWLQEHFPCTLSDKQWRLWTRTKTGSFRARKIPTPGRADT